MHFLTPVEWIESRFSSTQCLSKNFPWVSIRIQKNTDPTWVIWPLLNQMLGLGARGGSRKMMDEASIPYVLHSISRTWKRVKDISFKAKVQTKKNSISVEMPSFGFLQMPQSWDAWLKVIASLKCSFLKLCPIPLSSKKLLLKPKYSPSIDNFSSVTSLNTWLFSKII